MNNPLRIVEQQMEIRMLARMVHFPAKSTVLEVGCGRGAGARFILRRFRPIRLYALDLDLKMIRKAGRFLSAKEREQVFLCVGDGFQLPFREETFDAVFGFGVLHHIPDWQGAVSEFARVLKAGGFYFLEELYPALYRNAVTKHILFHPSENRFSAREFKAVLGAFRLEIVRVKEHPKLGILAIAVKRNVGS